MNTDSLLPILWRRKWIIVAVVAVFLVAAFIVGKVVSKQYETSSELLIAQSGTSQSFDAVQAAQVSARTYSTIITSPNVAELVSKALGGRYTRDQLTAKITADPVAETQLVRVTVSDADPVEAKRLVDTYVSVFVNYVRTQLFPTTHVSVSVADVAPVPDSPVRPRPKLYLLLAFIIGLGGGVGLALLRERLDTRIRDIEQIETEFGLPILARLPRGGRSGVDSSILTEALRIARASLEFAGERPLRTISVTSYGPGEGKSTTVTHLAMAIASSGGSALVVESDVHRPALQQFFRPDDREPLKPGFTNYIVGTVKLSEAIHHTRYPSIELMPAGPRVPSLSGLLQSGRGTPVMRAIGEHGELVLFDLPPLTAGADAVTISAASDGVVLVVDLETSTRRTIAEALRQLQSVRANVVGMVINRDRSVTTGAYGYGYGPGAVE